MAVSLPPYYSYAYGTGGAAPTNLQTPYSAVQQAEKAGIGTSSLQQGLQPQTPQIQGLLSGIGPTTPGAAITPGQYYSTGGGILGQLQQYGTGQQALPTLAPQLEQVSLYEKAARQAAAQQAGAGTAGAWSQLAATGGLGSGARERLASQAQRNLANQYQNIGAGAASQRAGIMAENAAQQMGILQNLPSQYMGYEQYGTGLGSQNRQYQTAVDQFNKNLEMTKLGVMTGTLSQDEANRQIAQQMDIARTLGLQAQDIAALKGESQNIYQAQTEAARFAEQQDAAKRLADQINAILNPPKIEQNITPTNYGAPVTGYFNDKLGRWVTPAEIINGTAPAKNE